ncbi:MAG: pyrroloquinoline quinone biosynthesis protein PqqB, partial [Egibacteraceae bacterium]
RYTAGIQHTTRAMLIRILGTAAGGGLPQWNCACQLCEAARCGGAEVPPRTQDCLAISGDGQGWYLVNASPDIRAQILATPALKPGPGPRETPIRGVLLTDAELDHTIGLLMLREGAALEVFGSEAVLGALRHDLPVREILDPYGQWSWAQVTPGETFDLDDVRILVTPFAVGDKRPRYAAGSHSAGQWVLAYRFHDVATGGVLVYAPCVASWPAGFDELIMDAGCRLLDGTFWTGAEMRGAIGHHAPAESMGHLPIDGPDGSLGALLRHPAVLRRYTHLNNTNPVTDAHSPERAALRAQGIDVAGDGTDLEL